MAALLGCCRWCLMLCICCLQIYESFTEQCSTNCSFTNFEGELRDCHVEQIKKVSLPTTQKCSDLLPSQFFAKEEDIPMRFKDGYVVGNFSQSSLDDLRIKIYVQISEASHSRINGIFFEVGEDNKHRYCFLMDFNGPLKLEDIVPESYSDGGDRILSFYPCMDASKTAEYAVVGYPLPLLNEPISGPKEPRINYQDSFNWFDWQMDKCKVDSEKYLQDSDLEIAFGRLEMNIHSSFLFNYSCPLVLRLIDQDTKEKIMEVAFTNGVAVASGIQRGSFKLRFLLDGIVGGQHNGYALYDITFKGKCLSFPCGDSAICQQHGNQQFSCSCPPDQTLKGNECFAANPCLNYPCGSGTCKRIETNSSIHHTCTCYREFFAAHGTCKVDPCNNNPCGSGKCSVNVSASEIYRSCECNPGDFVTQDVTCRPDPCFNNPCGNNGECSRTEINSDIGHICQCDPSFYNHENTCKRDPCYNNPCGNGTCGHVFEASEIHRSCKCNPGFYAAHDTCKTDPCYNNPCGNGNCSRVLEASEIHRSCKCNPGFYAAYDTCRTDPCYNNPCGNGTCGHVFEASEIHRSCKCRSGFYAANDTCKRDYCYANQCHPGNCTEEGNGFTCICPPTHISVDGKCLQNEENVVVDVILGVIGGLIGLLMILILFVYRRRRDKTEYDQPPPLPVLVEVDEPTGFDFHMLDELRKGGSTSSTAESSLDSNDHVKAATVEAQPLISRSGPMPQDLRGQRHHSSPYSSLPSTSQYNPGHDTCKFPSRNRKPEFPEEPGVVDIQPCSCSMRDASNQLLSTNDSTNVPPSSEYCSDDTESSV